jgi:DNA-binding PadR family transcriptional regulator
MSRKSHSLEAKAERRRRKEQAKGRKSLKRLLAHGDLRFLILSLIGEKPRHGYELIKEIEERVLGAYTPSPGVIYPTLTMLEDLGWVRVSTGGGTKKLHEITEEGRLALQVNRSTLDAIFERVAAARLAPVAGQESETDVTPDAKTAIGNARKSLKRALRRRLADTPLSEAQVGAITGALMTAANTIENA